MNENGILMYMLDISIFVAFTAGIVSFLLPCILPVIPGYLAYLGGATTETDPKIARKQVFINSVFLCSDSALYLLHLE